MVKPLVSLKNIKRYYGHGATVVRALDDVSLDIYPGEFVAIMGQSGSGKSTMMNLIGLLDSPTEGSYEINGQEVARLKPDDLALLRRDFFGFIFQRYNLLGMDTALENIEVPALYAGLSAAKRRTRSQELLESLGLGDRGTHRPNELSGGQQQRVAIARALMNDPPIILADEPTGALDSKSSEDVMKLLQELHAQGRTIIVITHEEEVAAYADRQIRLADGKVIADEGKKFDKEAAKDAKEFSHNHKTVGFGMELSESVKMALRSLRMNIFRTALTLLGIVIGVASVVTMLAIGEGSKQDVMASISSMGTNILSISPGGQRGRSSGESVTLKIDDAKAIEEKIDNIEAIVPEKSGSKTLRYGNIDYRSRIEGVGEAFPQAQDWPIDKGVFFTSRDISDYAAVIVLGSTVAKTLFPYEDDPSGKFIMVGNIPFEVIGVMGAKGATPWGRDRDDAAWVPYSTAMVRLFGSDHLNGITLKVADVDKIEQTEKDITALLEERHGSSDSFRVRNTASFLDMATKTQDTLTYLLGAVAAISLFVGGIGVMNIMLVSVIERTREIGIRMATGARRRNIMMQFNTEATVVCLIGGIVGILLGYGIGYGLSLFEVKVAFTPMPSILAFSCAVGTGMIFGILPARKASRLDPVEALSSE
jgi:macrolide transport system ATP-binding/permease protein